MNKPCRTGRHRYRRQVYIDPGDRLVASHEVLGVWRRNGMYEHLQNNSVLANPDDWARMQAWIAASQHGPVERTQPHAEPPRPVEAAHDRAVIEPRSLWSRAFGKKDLRR